MDLTARACALEAASRAGDWAVALRVRRIAGAGAAGDPPTRFVDVGGTHGSFAVATQIGHRADVGAAWAFGARSTGGPDNTWRADSAIGGFALGAAQRLGRTVYGVRIERPAMAHLGVVDSAGSLITAPLRSRSAVVRVYAHHARAKADDAVAITIARHTPLEGSFEGYGGLASGRLSSSALSVGATAALQRRNGSTFLALEAGGGYWSGTASGRVSALPFSGLVGGVYTLQADLTGPWAHVAGSVTQDLGSRLAVTIGLRADATWPSGRILVLDRGPVFVAPRPLEDLQYGGRPGWFLAPSAGVSYRLGSFELAWAVAWPIPAPPSAEGVEPAPTPPPERARARLPVRHVLSATYAF